MIHLGPRARGRRQLLVFQSINMVSFLLLSGNLITLFVLRLGGGEGYVGLISALPYASMGLMLVGRRFISRMGYSRLMGTFWFIRYLFMVPLLAAPFLLDKIGSAGVLGMVLACLIGFQIARGLGVVGYNPILAYVSEGPDRGDFLSRIHIVIQAVSFAGGLAMALLLSAEASLTRYSWFIGAGILMGFAASYIISRAPEPDRAEVPQGALMKDVKEALGERNFRRFIIMLFLVSLVIGMVPPFAIVYARRFFGMPDGRILFLTLAGNVGALLMGYAARLLMDRIGPKAFIQMFMGVLAAASIALALITGLQGVGLFLAMLFLFMASQFGFMGVKNAAQAYFFSIIPKKRQVSLSILYNLTEGVSGALGPLLGGLYLEFAKPVMGDALRFASFFLIAAGGTAVLSMLIGTLAKAGGYSTLEALNRIFSPRDFRAFLALKQLDRAQTDAEQRRALQALRAAPSSVNRRELLARLSAPRFTIRREALLALEEVPPDDATVDELLEELHRGEYTTAFIAARILGRHGVRRAIPALEACLDSSDYLLRGNAVYSLAQMLGVDAEQRVLAGLEGKNPRVALSAAAAARFCPTENVFRKLLVRAARVERVAALRDECLLSAAGLLGADDTFFAAYGSFEDSPSHSIETLKDWAGVRGRGETCDSVIPWIQSIETTPPAVLTGKDWLDEVLGDLVTVLPSGRARLFILAAVVLGPSSTIEEGTGNVWARKNRDPEE